MLRPVLLLPPLKRLYLSPHHLLPLFGKLPKPLALPFLPGQPPLPLLIRKLGRAAALPLFKSAPMPLLPFLEALPAGRLLPASCRLPCSRQPLPRLLLGASPGTQHAFPSAVPAPASLSILLRTEKREPQAELGLAGGLLRDTYHCMYRSPNLLQGACCPTAEPSRSLFSGWRHHAL